MICAPYRELILPEKLMNPNWEKAIAWIKADSWKDLPLGKTEIDAARLYVIRSSYVNKRRNECRYESHRLYADIQMVIKGSEAALVCQRDGLKIVEPYSAENDVDLLEGETEPVHTVVLGYPLAAVFFPWDVHMPSVAIHDKPCEVEKIVLKVALK